MKIAVAVKVVADDQDITVAGDRSLDYSKAKPVISTYDKNAIEAAAQLASSTGGEADVISAASADYDAKTKKDIRSRGVNELKVATGVADTADSYATAQALKDLCAGYDLIITGEGSADFYAGQVNVQLAAALGYPVINEVTAIEAADGKVVVKRTLDTEVQTVEVPLPAVVSVSPAICEARIPGMRDILQAGKKPSSAADVAVETKVSYDEILAPVPADRKNQIFDDVNAFAAAVAEALK